MISSEHLANFCVCVCVSWMIPDGSGRVRADGAALGWFWTGAGADVGTLTPAFHLLLYLEA